MFSLDHLSYMSGFYRYLFFQDRDALMKLLTFESVEETILKRVEKKAMTFGQEVNLGSNVGKPKYKLDPAVVSQLYKEWIIPLTKLVQVEYLLVG